MKPLHSQPVSASQPGFALVVTLSMMVILTTVAVGLLSLSAVSLKSSSLESSQARARANARMALMIAIDRLQTELGPDQRVSANGAILSASTVPNPNWLGVWESWKAGPDSDDQENPSPPSDHRTIVANNDQVRDGMAPTYQPNRADHFRAWLVSQPDSDVASNINTPRTALSGSRTPTNQHQAVILVDQGTLGARATDQGPQDPDKVVVPLVKVEANDNGPQVSGRYAWWVGDESQKARIMDDSYQTSGEPLTKADHLFRRQAPAAMGNLTVDELANLSNQGKQQLSSIISSKSLDLLDGIDAGTGTNAPRPSQRFHDLSTASVGLLTDVREGGMKRDLSVLLEQPIQPTNTGDQYMLYRFNTKDGWITNNDIAYNAGSIDTTYQECVPISDLAAYYQLYDGSMRSRGGIDHSQWKKGVVYSSNLLSNDMQLVSPDYGDKTANNPAYYREYTNLYRQPVVLRLQFLLSFFAMPDTEAPPPSRTNPNPYTHLLVVGITPALTLWNPNNVPLTMNFNDADPNRYAAFMRVGPVPVGIQIRKYDRGSTLDYTSEDAHILKYRGAYDGAKPELLNLYYSGRHSIVFEPGQVRTFSLPYIGDVSEAKGQLGYNGHWNQAGNMASFFFKTDEYFEGHEVIPGWEPDSFIFYNNSGIGGDAAHTKNGMLKLKRTDELAYTITVNSSVVGGSDVSGGGPISFTTIQSNHQSFDGPGTWGRRNYVLDSAGGASNNAAHKQYMAEFFRRGFPNESTAINSTETINVNELIQMSMQINDEPVRGRPFLQFALQYGAESADDRKFASRPFLHASPIRPAFLDNLTGGSLYSAGWNWEVNEITNAFDSVETDGPNGFYGGGYDSVTGTSHVVQQEIPVTAPISIASLSHAQLGGFSLAKDEAEAAASQNITACGQAGLFPHTQQAIGNSYAHPNLAADKAYNAQFDRQIRSVAGIKQIAFADHSYLANKALWDEFFFSSISPQPDNLDIFEGPDVSAETMASDFFFNNKPLPNRRILPYTTWLDADKLDEMFNEYNTFSSGLADKIGGHLLIKGPFNVNSTSVEAWKVLLTSLKDQPILVRVPELSADPAEQTTTGVVVGQTTMANGEPAEAANSAHTPEQWVSPRTLNDEEIDQLAEAIVRQVKLRGPFLSLSEFINRRLDAGQKQLSVKGALQAALDDEQVDINKPFKSGNRDFTGQEVSSVTKFNNLAGNPEFPEAVEGPVAYGSMPYVDQADILRQIGNQLTPRGDTFVIRTYGDALDARGNVEARAWCEAVIQRIPDYVVPKNDNNPNSVGDRPETKHADLTATANQTFGRKLQMVSFRWLNASEI